MRRGPRAHTNANIIDCRRDIQYPRSCFFSALLIIYLVFASGTNGQDSYAFIPLQSTRENRQIKFFMSQ